MPLPWSRKQGEELPDELKNMEAKDLVDAVSKAKEVDKLKGDLEALSKKANEVDELKNQLASLELKLKPVEEKKEKTPGEPRSFFDDEDGAFADRITPFAVQTLNTQAQAARFMAKSSLKGVDKEIWDKWEGEIDKVMETVDLNWRANPQTWANALDTVAGRHRNDIIKMQQEKTEFFSEVPANGGHGGPGHEEPPQRLSEEQERIAKRLGISNEDYLKNLKEMTVHG